MYDYEILYDDYIGYIWDTETTPERKVYYTTRSATQALRRFYEDYPLHAINRIQRCEPEITISE